MTYVVSAETLNTFKTV